MQPHQISMRRDSSKAVATDAEGHELHINDNVKEVDGAVSGIYFVSLLKLKVRLTGPKRAGATQPSIVLRIPP